MITKVGKRGDTLVEVMLAVGIFSMVAVAVVAVMSGGTSSAQTSLETTLAREEIDNQTEALRFIHRSYVSDVQTGNNSPFGALWGKITSLAVPSDKISDFSQYQPDTCQNLYNTDNQANGRLNYGEAVSNKSFVINTQQLSRFASQDALNANNILPGSPDYNNMLNTVIATPNNFPFAFTEAATYPHLIYGTQSDLEQSLSSHAADATGNNAALYRAEGIYIIAIADPGSTALTGGDAFNHNSAYYDFYVRTCWYGTGDQSPSTISTVIRLYNPDINSST